MSRTIFTDLGKTSRHVKACREPFLPIWVKDTLQGAPALSNLQLLQCACVDDNGISELVSVINPRLRGFEASNLPSITTAAVQVLSEHCRELQSVKFVSCSKLDRYCLQALGQNCKKLRTVSFLKENEDDEWCLEDDALTLLVEHFSSNLETAAFVGFKDITDDALINISKHFSSSVIDVDFSASHRITDYGLRILATRCKQLQSLALSNTSITDKGIYYLADNCRHLRKLNVSGCQNITDVGLKAIVRKCCELEYLTATTCEQVSDTSLLELNKELPRLKELYLRDTSTTQIAKSIQEVQDLKELNLSMCKELPHPPPDIVNGDADRIGDCLEGRSVAYRRRVLMLGDAGGGKTSIVKSLCSGSAQVADSPTDGVDIQRLCPFKDLSNHNLVDHKLDDDEKSLVLEIWDGAGRRIWQQCHSLFLLQQSVCVVVFNLADQSSCRSVARYLQFIQAKVPDSHVVIIGTHEDKLPDKEQQEDKCKEILKETERRWQRQHDELQKELDVLNDIPGRKCCKVNHKIQQLREIINKLQTPSNILTVSNVTAKGLDDVKKAIFETVLHVKRQNNGINNGIKEAISKCYQQMESLCKENIVVVSKDTLCTKAKPDTDIDLKNADENEMKDAKDGNHIKEEEKEEKEKAGHKLECSKDKLLKYLQAVGAVLEVNPCNKVISHSPSPQLHDENSSKETVSTPSPSNSEEHNASKMSPANSEDQSTPSVPLLLCINPVALAQAILAIHVDDTKKAFKFEANKFWPKSEGAKKPNPAVLVHALEEVATQGLIRECLFPLLWQNLGLNEAQTRLLIDVLYSLGILVRTLLPASGEPDCQCLRLPHYSNLSTQQQYRLPLLGLLIEQGPSLNWTPKPFQGDIEITWQYEFLGTEIPPSIITRMLAFCHNQCPTQAVYQHYWNNGVLMKMGQVYIHMSQQTDTTSQHVNFTGRITTDEEGERKATELLWVALSHFLICAQQYLKEWPGLEYKVTLLPSKAYYECSNSDFDRLEVPLLLCLQMLAQGQSTLDVVSEDREYKVQLNTLLPITGDPELSIDEWLEWLSVQPVVWTDQNSSPENPVIDEEMAADGGDESSLGASPKADTSDVVQQEGLSPLPSKDKVVAKKKEIKWDLGGHRITEEEQIREAKKVAATFIAAVLAGAMAQYIAEEVKGPNAEAAALASAQAAKAALCGDPEAAAKAVIAAAQAVTGGTSNGRSGDNRIRSRMCALI